MDLEFARPAALYALALLPLWWALTWPRGRSGVLFARADLAGRHQGRWGVRAAAVAAFPRVLRSLQVAALIIALAEPQRIEVVEERRLQGAAIGLALDLSSSMLAVDAERGGSRMDVARRAAARFAQGRPHDELSLVAFAGAATTRVPPTTDANLIVRGIESLKVQVVPDGTDIAAGLLAALGRLIESPREPRVIILLTDGAHNGSGVQPLAAARAAAALGVRVHTISILGPNDPIGPPTRAAGSSDRETVLTAIAALTGGRYFGARVGSLDSIYRVINRLESPEEHLTQREERHGQRHWVLLAALALLGLEGLLRGSRWGVVP